jgi:hypothetical protein
MEFARFRFAAHFSKQFLAPYWGVEVVELLVFIKKGEFQGFQMH